MNVKRILDSLPMVINKKRGPIPSKDHMIVTDMNGSVCCRLDYEEFSFHTDARTVDEAYLGILSQIKSATGVTPL